MKTVLKTIKKAGIVMLKAGGTILFLFALLVAYRHIRSLHDEADFKYYMKHFHHVGTGYINAVRTFPYSFYRGTGEEAVRRIGQPESMEQDYYPPEDRRNPNKAQYTDLYYDGYSFGMFGDKNGQICCVRVSKAGLCPLRNGIDIGSTRAEVESAFQGIKHATDSENVFIITHKDEKSHNGIWIYMYYDGDDRLIEFHVTDGF